MLGIIETLSKIPTILFGDLVGYLVR